METVYVGYLRYIGMTRSASGDYVDTEVSFVDRSMPYGLQNLDNERCYLVKKDELDTYMARKEELEQMNCTPVYDENQRLKAKVNGLEAENAYLTRINEDFFKERSKLVEKNEALKERLNKFYGRCSAESEIKEANEKLKTENGELKEKIEELKVIKSFLEVGNERLIRRNTEMESRSRNLELENAKLKGELAQAEYELASFNGEHTVEFLYEKHEDGKHIVGWTEVSGKEYELTFLTPERKIYE